jgi:hypothetical protein
VGKQESYRFVGEGTESAAQCIDNRNIYIICSAPAEAYTLHTKILAWYVKERGWQSVNRCEEVSSVAGRHRRPENRSNTKLDTVVRP